MHGVLFSQALVAGLKEHFAVTTVVASHENLGIRGRWQEMLVLLVVCPEQGRGRACSCVPERRLSGRVEQTLILGVLKEDRG